MKFAIFREIVQEGKKQRRFLVEWNKDDIIKALAKELEIREYNVRMAFVKIIEDFKKESIRIP